MAPAEKTPTITRVGYLERQVFDHSGRFRRGMDGARAGESIEQIDQLRSSLGWLEIDLRDRRRSPACH
jgi:hypothetical protein